MNTDNFFKLGVKLAAAHHNRTPSNLCLISGVVAQTQNVTDPNYGSLQRMVCKVAADVFDEAGQKDDLTYHAMSKLATAPTWYPALDVFSDAALRALGVVTKEVHDKQAHANNERTTEKAASSLLGLASRVSTAIPSSAKALAGMGAVGGGLAGGLYWLLNRDSAEDEADSEVVKAKIDYYNRLASEIKGQLKQTPANTPADIQNVVQKLV